MVRRPISVQPPCHLSEVCKQGYVNGSPFSIAKTVKHVHFLGLVSTICYWDSVAIEIEYIETMLYRKTLVIIQVGSSLKGDVASERINVLPSTPLSEPSTRTHWGPVGVVWGRQPTTTTTALIVFGLLTLFRFICSLGDITCRFLLLNTLKCF